MTTALVKLKDKRGNLVVARALLDSCSTVNLITETFANSLALPNSPCSVNIEAVDGLSTAVNKFIQTSVHSNYNNSNFPVRFLIVPRIADAVPNDTFPRKLFDIPKNLKLADPQFHLPKSIDILLSSSTTLSVLAVGQIKLRHKESEIILQKTSLGWVVAGGVRDQPSPNSARCNLTKLDKLVERFWLIEDFDHEPIKSRDDVACEQHFLNHTQRDPSGRYIVRLPFRDSKFKLGESKSQALKRFHFLERRFERDPSLKVEYSKVMNEYLTLGHMSLSEDSEDSYYLPHHAVIKQSSETTKAPPCKTPSLSKCLGSGLIRKLSTCQLNTVTFGTASAPFLAIRTIQQLARDEAKDFPRASKILLRDFYVDDLVSGGETLEEILAIRDEMIALLRRGGFAIRKWASNHSSALDSIDKTIFDLDCVIKEDPIQKMLGIVWDSKQDLLQYSTNVVDAQATSTKRLLLSETSKIYDPLGLLGPVVLYAKVLIQDCWKAKITWDESLPQDISFKWKSLTSELALLRQVSFPRQFLVSNPIQVQVLGFCDACSYGYGACMFLRSSDSTNTVVIRLICSKSRVAPLKGVTIPRLELCSASLLKKLYVEAKPQFNFPINQTIFWSDSTIVLAWLRKAPHLLRVFESNRVADIQTLGDQVEWRHVRSEDNPADALSRGQLPSEFINNSLWTSGPPWLALPPRDWPTSAHLSPKDLPGLKQGTCLVTNPVPVSSFSEIYSRFSSYDRFTRIIAYVSRWKLTCRNPNQRIRLFPEITDPSNRIRKIIALMPPLLVLEVAASETKILKLLQQERFSLELRQLSNSSGSCRKGTSFDKLTPFIDDQGLIRVGGRLKEADLPYDQKHPILLPRDHHITNLLIRKVHRSNLHAGIQTTLYAIRSKFFIINGKRQIRKIIHSCVDCIRQKPPAAHAQMGNLPKARVEGSPAFDHTGVDFFGPMLIKEKKNRNKSFLKVYGSVFICLASKAVHIELVSDLSTEGFLIAFRRFVSRRGIPSNVYSDNGTNFVGADRQLQELYDLFEKPEFRERVGEHAITKRIQWHFNPPLSPHFGGLWEAAVKSFKHHLKRILDKQLTFEQLETFLIEIEAILNSRPLCALSADPNDPLAITPAHLLIGRPFNVLPEESLISVTSNRLSTTNFMIQARQNFWMKWHREYLHEIQLQQKWHTSNSEIKPGLVVLMMDDLTHCARWPLGVILEVFPGSDGIARVASVKTTAGVYKRNITRLCILPTER
ncbi:uncharacterized protein LOC131674012 [Phymastichus coffea]|uniref:uncharacterized protein LOC131674012 n=1 Tax=Phymastichus coffea TaxID=108790 RepID=UPI00273CBD77|nr:uncharacterized protein LOC131674012 [Phymastichus coffea]